MRSVMSYFKALIRRLVRDDVMSVAAQIAFFLLLSIFPFLMFLSALLASVRVDRTPLLEQFQRLMPDYAYRLMLDVLDSVARGNSASLVSFSMIAAIWAASSGVNALLRNVGLAFDARRPRPWWRQQLLSLIFTVLMAVFFAVAALSFVFGRVISERLITWLGFSEVFRAGWDLLRLGVAPVALFLILVLFYRLGPSDHPPYRKIIPGALFATLGIGVLSVIFSTYIASFGTYSRYYGSLGMIIATMIWLYWSSCVLLVGAQAGALLTLWRPRTFGRRTLTDPELPGDGNTRSGGH